MIANYHTHTWRCRHADGTEREYVERAIEGGLKILGFSDHSPYPFPDGYDSGMRMRLDQVEGYFIKIGRKRGKQLVVIIPDLLAVSAEVAPEYIQVID